MSRQDKDLTDACDWVVRLEADDAGPQDWALFTAWLDGGEERRAAFDRAQALSLSLSGQGGGATLAPDSRSVRAAAPLASRRAVLWGGLAAACAALAATPLLIDRTSAQTLDINVPRGERRKIALEDGSSLWVAGPAKLHATMSAAKRHVRLIEGEAAFDVRHDARRPFLVEVDHRRVTVLGTEFNIRREARRMTLSVRRGLVEVAAQGDRSGGVTQVAAGGRLVHEAGAARAVVTRAEVDLAFTWREGRLVYRDGRLGAVVEDLNRYLPLSVRLEDPALAQLPFSGVVQLDDPAVVIERVSQLTGLKARIQNDVVVLGADRA